MWNPGPSTFSQDSAGGSSDFIAAPHTSVCGVTKVNAGGHRILISLELHNSVYYIKMLRKKIYMFELFFSEFASYNEFAVWLNL